MRPLPPALLALAAIAGGCGHVPLASLPKLSKIDIRTTDLAELRAGISLPADIRRRHHDGRRPAEGRRAP